MLWSPAILLLLVGAAFARPQNAWENGKEYTYRVRSRTLSSFNPQSKQFTGVVMEAYLTVQSNGQDLLRARISNPKHSQIHTHLENGWESEIPRNQLNLQNFPLSGEPFEIKTKNGVVQDLIVNKEVPTWEVNIIKSIVSQFQVDTQGQNVQRSQYNQLPEGDQPYAMFRAMEDSVGGECEVLYDISPVSEQILQNIPEAVPMPQLREDGEIISVVKTKNYSNCDQRIGFHYGLNGHNNWEPGSNENGKHLSRSSISRIFISGNLKKYTIQSSVTRNKIVLSPDQHENQQGMVASKMNLTLHEVKDISESMPAPTNPQSTGNLVYNYNVPHGNPESRRHNKPKSDRYQQDYHRSQHYNRNSDEQDHHRSQHYNRNSDEQDSRRSQYYNRNSDESSNEHEFNEDRDSYLLPQPKLSEAPQYAMLPFYIGYKGNAIYKNSQVDVVASAKRIAQQIGDEFKSPDSMVEAQTLEKFLILTKLVRLMNVEQISEVQQALYQKAPSQNDLNQRSEDEHTRRHMWVAFRDAVAQAGTGPALLNVKRWIQNQQIQGNEAANVIDTVGRSAYTPNSEYLDAFFELIRLKELKNQPRLKYIATMAFADLIRHAAVNKQSAHNRYPVHVFGRLISKNNRDVQEKYIPYLAEELKSAVENGDSRTIRAYITALGKTGHPQILSVYEPYLEGKKQISQFQRLTMVAMLKYLTRTYPKIARSVLYKIYSNSNESYDIRTVAVYSLMYTNPPASMLQRMAENTNYDSNKHVNSAVKSVIESIAQLPSDASSDLLDGARAAVPLLTPETYGPQYSRAIYKSFKNYLTHSELEVEATFIGSEDSVIPKSSSVIFYPTYNGIKGTKIELGGAVSSVADLFKFMQHQWYNSKSNKNQKTHQKYSPENLAAMLGIYGESPKQVEGVLYASSRSAEQVFSFDNHTLEDIPQYLKHLKEDLQRGLHVDRTRFGNSELVISFPTETGYPVVYAHNSPYVTSVHGKYQANYESNSEHQSLAPKLLAGSGKVRLVYGMKDQKRLGFVTPFENQEYIAGVDKNLQVHLPVQSDVEYNNEKKEVRVKIQPNDNKEFRIVQFKTQPFTTKHDLTNLQPIANSEETHTVHRSHAVSSHSVVNDEKKQPRLEFYYEKLPNGQQGQSYNKHNAYEAAHSLARSVATMLSFTHERTEYEVYSVKVYPSHDVNAELKVSYDSSINEGNNGSSDDSENSSPNAQLPQLEKSYGQTERKRKLLQEVSKNINYPKAHAVDISLQLGAQSGISLTTAVAESNVEQKSRAAIYAYAKCKDGEDYYFSAGYEGKHPYAWSMDYEDILKYNAPYEFDAKIYTGRGKGDNKEQDKVRIQGYMKQSEERKNWIRQSYEAQDCTKQQTRNGNKITSYCEAVNERALSKDTAELSVTFEKDSHMKYSVLKALDVLEYWAGNYVQIEKNSQNKAEHDKIKIYARATPDAEKLNVAVKSPEGELKFNDMYVGHKSQYYKNNENSNNKLPYYQKVTESTCYLDKSAVQTFDHHEYPAELGQCWHVAVTSYPKNNPDNPTQKLEIPENMHFSVLVRDNENGQRDLKITLQDKEVEIYQPEPQSPRVKINGRDVKLSHSQSIQEVQNGQRLFEILKLRDNTVKFASEQLDFMIIYDGQRAKIMVGERYRNSVRGLCGNYDGEPSNDQQTPKGCQVQKPYEFAASYALLNDQCTGPVREYADKLKNAHCAYQYVRAGNVISDEEAGRQSQRYTNEKEHQEESCMRYRTKVVASDTEICFSVRPVAACSSKCSPVSMQSKSIQLHCVPRTTASEKVADRVRSGANPDLSQKKVTKTESYEVPQRCSA